MKSKRLLPALVLLGAAVVFTRPELRYSSYDAYYSCPEIAEGLLMAAGLVLLYAGIRAGDNLRRKASRIPKFIPLTCLLMAVTFGILLVQFLLTAHLPQMPSTSHLVNCNDDCSFNTAYSQSYLRSLSSYWEVISSYWTRIWLLLFATLVSIAASILQILIPKAKIPSELKKELILPKPFRYAIAIVGGICFLVFGYAEFFSVLYANTGYHLFIEMFDAMPNAPVCAVWGLAAASVSFGILQAKKGLSEGIKAGVMFDSVSLFIVQLCLLVFDYKEMYLQVANFSKYWTPFGFPALLRLRDLSLQNLLLLQLGTER